MNRIVRTLKVLDVGPPSLHTCVKLLRTRVMRLGLDLMQIIPLAYR